MTDTADTKRCSRCGAEYSGQASPLGLCPACLLALGMSDPSWTPPADSSAAGESPASPQTVATHMVAQRPSMWARARHTLTNHRRPVLLTMIAVASLIAITMFLNALFPGRVQDAQQPASSVVRFTLPWPQDTQALDGAQFAVSPDGTAVAIAARGVGGQSHLWLRRLQALDWIELPRTEGATFPFWSPDSRHVGFFAERQLKRIDIANGLTQAVCDAPNARGGTWGIRDEIVFADGATRTLMRVPARGGERQPITRLGQGEIAHVWPRFLANGRHVVFFANAPDTQAKGTYAIDLDIADGRRILIARRIVTTVPISNVLLRPFSGSLVAQRFDVARPEPGDDGQVISGVERVTGTAEAGPTFAASHNVLVYRSAGDQKTQLTWLDRDGRIIGTIGDPGDYGDWSMGPDGRSVVVSRREDQSPRSNLWVIDLTRGTSSRLTFDPERDASPVWSPDARRLAFAARREQQVLLTTSVTNGAKADQIATSPFSMRPTDWSKDGRLLLYTVDDPRTALDVLMLPMAGDDRKPSPLLQGPFNESDAHFSPDGRLVAYVSNETGRDEVFVRSFPEAEGKSLISLDGGSRPRWGADGRELFFVSADGKLMATAIETRPTFRAGQPRALLDLGRSRVYEVSADGRRFVTQMPLQDQPDELHVVLNWMNELR
jgi:dipeptidyl aminopeptidase/acylaminoacyl peptidase